MKKLRKSKPIGVLTKTFRLLQEIQAAPANLTELSLRTRINKSTALRILAHLESEGYVARDAHGSYRAGGALLRLGVRTSFEIQLREAAQAPLRELWRVTQETVNLGLLDGLEVVYLESLESPQSFRLVANAGTRAAAYRTAIGKAVLACATPAEREAAVSAFTFRPYTPKTITTAARLQQELDQVIANGYAIDDEESLLGVRCLAVPIRGVDGQAVAGISISGPTSRITEDRLPDFAQALKTAAAAIASSAFSASLREPLPDRFLVQNG